MFGESACSRWLPLMGSRFREGTHPLASALDEVVSNSELREIFFISHLVLHGKHSLPASAAFATQQPAKYQKGIGKNAKGKKVPNHQSPPISMPTWPMVLRSALTSINGVGCSNTQCPRAHVCRLCLGEHSTQSCPRATQSPSPASSSQ
eukprot:1217551-Amphidinium_carterae.2